jgi:hypothetical protein
MKSSRPIEVYGFSVPPEISKFYKECWFNVEKVGTKIIFTSGTHLIPTKEQIKNYEFGDCRC